MESVSERALEFLTFHKRQYGAVGRIGLKRQTAELESLLCDLLAGWHPLK